MRTRYRATQLRASFLRDGGRLRVVWWISNTALTLDQLVDDARLDLPDLLVREHVQLGRRETWRAFEADGLHWLRLDATANTWTDPRRDRLRRATTP